MIPTTIRDEIDAVKYLSKRQYLNIEELLDDWKVNQESKNRLKTKVDCNVSSLYQKIHYSNKKGD